MFNITGSYFYNDFVFGFNAQIRGHVLYMNFSLHDTYKIIFNFWISVEPYKRY